MFEISKSSKVTVISTSSLFLSVTEYSSVKAVDLSPKSVSDPLITGEVFDLVKVYFLDVVAPLLSFAVIVIVCLPKLKSSIFTG